MEIIVITPLELENIIRRSISDYVKQVKKIETADNDFYKIRNLLRTPISDLDLSGHTSKALQKNNIVTLGDVVSHHEYQLLKLHWFGKCSLRELEEIVIQKGLSFGMDVNKYLIAEDLP